MPDAAASTSSPAKPSRKNSKPESVPWRDRPLLTLQMASEVSGVSRSALYALEAQGKLTLRRFGGRTLVPTAELAKLIDNAELWTPLDRGKEARAKRAEIARSNWRG